MRYFNIATVALLVLSSPWAGKANAQCDREEDFKVIASDGQTNDCLGRSVDVSGDWTVVGARDVDGGDGAVYVYRTIGGAIVEETIIQSTSLGNHLFGYDVAIDGNRMIASELAYDGGRGLIWVYELHGGQWIQSTSFSDGQVGDYYGRSIDIDGDTIAVGAPGISGDQGLVYIRQLQAGAWTYQTSLDAYDSIDEGFGFSVSLSGSNLAIGSPFVDATYVYGGAADTWNLERKLFPLAPGPSAYYGYSVSVDNDRLVVSAPYQTVLGVQTGAVHTYERRSAALWAGLGIIVPGDLGNNAAFGYDVALNGDVFVAGAPFATTGKAYEYRFHDDSWYAQERLVASDAVVDQYHGFSVGIDGDRVAVGAIHSSGSELDTGALYLYDVADVALDISPDVAFLGNNIEFSVCGGRPTNPVVLFVQALNGSPVSIPLFIGNFGFDGTYNLQGPYSDPVLAGLDLEFIAIALSSYNTAVLSDPRLLQLQ